MRKLTFLLIPMLLIALPFISHGEEATAEAKPAVYGVMMYADWCGACKALDPKVVEARNNAELDKTDILFVRWDLTNDVTKHQAKMMASIMGLSELYEANAGKTGFMLLVDANSGEKISRLTGKYEADEIAAKIQASIKTSSEATNS